MKHVAVGASLLFSSLVANAFDGIVTDDKGQPISNASVEVVGSKSAARTNAQGKFHLDEIDIDELHVQAEGYSHRVLHLHGEAIEPLNIVLSTSIVEQVDVIGLPIHASIMESVQPISVVSGDELRNKQAGTLGETLKYEIGVHSSYFGPNTSSPIIRGLDGPRVLITQNGLDVSDASRVGPDHAVASEATTAEQIEILRGPATLFYGSGAIGGVVNVVDDRVPSDSESRAAFNISHDTVNSEDSLSAAYTGGSDILAVHLDGFWRDSENIKLPDDLHQEHDSDEEEEHHSDTLANSASEGQGYNLGASWLVDNGYIGLSYGYLDRLSGVPGHGAHGEEDGDDIHSGEKVLSDLEQERWQLLSDIALDHPLISGINTRIGYTDYQHAEIHAGEDEDAAVEGDEHHEDGTVFTNKTLQLRTDIVHQELQGWRGAFSLEAKTVDFKAVGEEAFTSPSKTDSLALALVEEKHLGAMLWQLGARIEQVSLSADDLELEVHDHEADGDEAHLDLTFDELSFHPYSLSAGAVWEFTEGYNVSAALTHAQRAPAAAELYSVGPHIGTGSYEIGALFELHPEADALHLDYHGQASEEKSNNLDLSLRKFSGDLSLVLNAFYNQVDDFYSSINTGYTSEDLFGHEEEVEAEDGHDHDALPIYIYQQQDTRFYGLEAELTWQLAAPLKWTIWGDSIRGKLKEGGNLPRIPPKRLGNQLVLEQGNWQAELNLVHNFAQNQTAVNESTTGNSTLLDAQISYRVNRQNGDITLYAKGQNLTDTEARIHSSFLKDFSPLPGRGFILGIRGSF